MTKTHFKENDFYAQRAIREIVKKYERLDGDFAKIAHFFVVDPAQVKVDGPKALGFSFKLGKCLKSLHSLGPRFFLLAKPNIELESIDVGWVHL